MIRRLQHTFGATRHALDWLTSYPQSYRPFVRLHGVAFAMSAVDNSVPQDLLLLSLYIAPLSALFRSFGLTYHQYADATHIYISVQNDELATKVDLLERRRFLACFTAASNLTQRRLTWSSSLLERDEIKSSHYFNFRRQYSAKVSYKLSWCHSLFNSTSMWQTSVKYATFTFEFCATCGVLFQTTPQKW